MVANITLTDVSENRSWTPTIDGAEDGLSRHHTVGQAIEAYLEHVDVEVDLRSTLAGSAFSRVRRLDNKTRLEDLSPSDDHLVVMPEVTAG